mgnify:CR=1 FL=1
MTAPAPVPNDPTMPGLSVRDLARRAIDAVSGAAGNDNRAKRHRDHVIRHDLARLDREALLDLGLDRDRA